MDINPTIIRNATLISVGMGAAFGLGYVIGVKRTARKFEGLIEQEIQSVKEAYGREPVIAPKPYATPQEAAAVLIPEEEVEDVQEEVEDVQEKVIKKRSALVEKVLEYGSAEVSDDPQLSTEQSRNIFDQAEEERGLDKPYLISVEEFLEDYEDHDKLTIYYWEGDDTLMDEREQLIPDVEGVVGSVHLTMFGEEIKKYSKDPNIVYVRNERLHADFEIVREEGSYSINVLGMDPDIIEGNEKRPIKKMRPDE